MSDEKITSTAIAAVEKKRLQIYKAMPIALQEVASEFEAKLGRGARSVVLLQYDMGARMTDIIKDEATYGSFAVQQLADYLNVPGGTTTLYNLRNLAQEFDRNYVKDWSAKPMANGRFLELAHWIALMRIKERKDQEKMLVRVLKNSMSANDLEKEIRAGSVKTKNARQGGRKPSRPSSAIAGLQKTFSMAQQLNRYEEVAEKDVFDVITEMPADEVTPALKERLEKTIKTLGETEEKAGAMKSRAEECLERVERVLSEKYEEAEGGDEEAEEKLVKKAKIGTKFGANGAVHGKKAKKVKKNTQTNDDVDEEGAEEDMSAEAFI